MGMHALSSPQRRSAPISVRTRGLALTDDLRRVIRRCVLAAVGRFSQRISSVFVWVEDTNGPKGGRAMRCRMLVRLERGGRFMVAAEAADQYVAIGRAANRMRVRLVRFIEKKRSWQREAPLSASEL